MTTYILVAGNAGIDNLVAQAKAIGEPATAVVVGERAVADAVAASGVDAVQWLGEPADRPAEAFAPAVAELVAAGSPGVVLAAGRAPERALVGATAARLSAPILTMVSEVTAEAGTITVTHGRLGGIAQRTVRASGPVVVVLDGGSVATGGAAQVEEVTGTVLEGVTVAQTREAEHAAVDLGKAKRVVSAGRGVRAKEDLHLIDELAGALDAEVACSRPLAEGLDWFSHDRYVGVTGQHISPDLYVAVGISGQLQHSVGARSARTIVVINSDENAPYVKEADYAVVGDLYQLVPAITEALR